MNKTNIVKLLLLFVTVSLHHQYIQAQTVNSVSEMLSLIGENNKELQAEKALTAAKNLEDKSNNSLPDPTVTYSHLWGNKNGMGFTGEFVAQQSFDFPTIYAQRKKLNRLRSSVYQHQEEANKENILLKAQISCFDLIYLHQLQELLKVRLDNAEKLSKLYHEKLEKGSTNRIELNKVDLELLNVKNQFRINETEIKAKLNDLQAMNGGESFVFNIKEYDSNPIIPNSFETIKNELLSSSAELNTLKSEKEAAYRQISLNKNQWLPGMNLGYRMNPSSGGQRFNGLIAGISIPLFANRNKVKQAKATALSLSNKYDSFEQTTLSYYQQLWEKASSLQQSIQEYKSMLESQNNIPMLNKAIESGAISLIEYFANINTLYQSIQNYKQLENEYQKTVAELYRYKL